MTTILIWCVLFPIAAYFIGKIIGHFAPLNRSVWIDSFNKRRI